MALTTRKIDEQILFSTKAQTLQQLSGRLSSAKILPIYYFSVEDWKADESRILAEIASLSWCHQPLIVRSSAKSEDTSVLSNAGKYLSVLDVNGVSDLVKSINKVIESYGEEQPDDQVLIQPMLDDVKFSGVAFGCDPNSGAPYFIINYDISTCTDSVTAGNKNLKTYIHHYEATLNYDVKFSGVIQLLIELSSTFDSNKIDIEFAVTNDDEIYLFQARPLVVNLHSEVSLLSQRQSLERISNFINDHMKPHTYLHGKTTVYGVMPDWNPAEIIGIKPKMLSATLYRDLVTDAVWAYQRDNYGYSNLRSFPLLVDFEGLPYIDVRLSFNSFLPKSLSPDVAEKLVNYYLDRLIENPALHDKVEFDIVFSCYTFDMRDRLSKLRGYDFDEKEINNISNALTELTNNIISHKDGLWRADLDKVNELEARQLDLINGDLDAISKMYWLLEDCKRYGTLPFAGLARAGFIAIQILKSLVAVNILSPDNYTEFLLSIDSVSSRMSRDFSSMTKEQFLIKYGHLRPGTYDITSYRYDEKPEQYFKWESQDIKNDGMVSKHDFRLSIGQLRAIEERIERDGLTINALELLEFIKIAIESREYSKFVFCKSISEFLRLLELYAAQFGISRDDCSYLNLKAVTTLYSSSVDPCRLLTESIKTGKSAYSLTKAIKLPPLITSSDDVWCFEYPETHPNFITQKSVVGDVLIVGAALDKLEGVIAFIESADPGYDWLFSHNIIAFVTKFGGANSHMAIRAGELGIPAIIGAGEVSYSQWSAASRLSINCLNQQVHII